MANLNCMNCKAEILAGQSKIFAQVLLCEACSTSARSFYEKLDQELRHLQTIAKEAIRVMLVQGKFRLPTAAGRELSKKEVLEEIVKMETVREAAERAKQR